MLISFIQSNLLNFFFLVFKYEYLHTNISILIKEKEPAPYLENLSSLLDEFYLQREYHYSAM